MIFSRPPLATILPNVLTLEKLRPKEEVVGGVHWSPQPGPGLCPLHPETSSQPGVLLGHTVHGGQEALLSPDSCSVHLLFVFRVNKYYSLKYHRTGLGFLAAITGLPAP